MDFCTLGMFIIDDIEYAKDQPPQRNVIGGAGTYSAVGAALFSKKVGWIVDAGNDFPDDVRETLLSWETALVLRPRDGPTTRGWNGYGDNDFRSFKYLTEKKRITAEDLTAELLTAKSFHLICSATRCMDLVRAISSRTQTKPLFIWEPVPDLCTSSEMANVREALRHVDILSPNHDELAALFDETGDINKVEDQVRKLINPNLAIVVRCGKDGCYAATTTQSAWIPAVHGSSKVVDPTGGGNGFLGGFAIGVVRTGDVVEASLYGSVAASFCIEQVGPPVLSNGLWNGVDPAERLQEFKRRCQTK